MTETTSTVAPQRRQQLIKRPRLTGLLDASKARVIMLIAPAGYGKTTLAREWLTQADRRAAWYLGSAATADVAALAQGVAAAVSKFVPDAGARMRDFLRASRSPEDEPETLALLLANDLRAWPKRTWLVIDDYHYARESHASEAFVEALVRLSPIRLLLTTRDRPSWLSARGVLYGEITEIGAALLTMNADEATEALSSRAPEEIAELVALSSGWPAVIGLASLNSDIKAPDVDMPLALYEFLAEEVYSSTPPELREGLERLAYMPRVSLAKAADILGTETEAFLTRGQALGLITPVGDDKTLELHPLLRVFLKRKLETDDNRRLFLASLADMLLASEEWDAAFEVASSLSSFRLFDRVLIQALDAILEQSRYSTLEGWLRWAFKAGYDSATLSLAQAELDLRSGSYRSAEALAEHAARSLGAPALTAKARLIAGRAAELASENERAITFFEAALDSSADASTRAKAAWARFACSYELGQPTVNDWFQDYKAARTNSFDDAVREQIGEMMMGSIAGNLEPLAPSPRAVESVLARVRDPMVRSSYLNRSVWTLVMVARYDEAQSVADVYLDFVRNAQLEFALPHALLLKGASEAGRKRYRAAEAALQDASERGAASNDDSIMMEARAFSARILIALGQWEDALDLTSADATRAPTRPLLNEYLATRALAMAYGQIDEAALALARSVERTTTDAEARCLAACVRGIVGLNTDRTDWLVDSFRFIEGRGGFDAFVTCYRSDPRVLAALADQPELHQTLWIVLHRAHDAARLVKRRLTHLEPASRLASLTSRESEVLELLADGLTNKKIGEALFISEATAKLHVRHIFQKLEVRTRTQAAGWVRGTG